MKRVLALVGGMGVCVAVVVSRLSCGDSQAIGGVHPAQAAAVPACPVALRCSPSLQPPMHASATGDDAPVLDAGSVGEYLTALRWLHEVSPHDLFVKESVDAAFAGRREAALLERITTRLRKRIEISPAVQVVCHSSSCEVTFEGQLDEEGFLRAERELDVQHLANASSSVPLQAPEGAPFRGLSIVMLFSPALRDHTEYERWLRHHAEQDGSPPDEQ